MTMNKNRGGDAGNLRRRSEEAVRRRGAPVTGNLEALGPDEIRRMLHELQVYQIELEMQNEELQQARAELEASRARYYELYDLAPVGYCTLDDGGVIQEANSTASSLLGLERGALTSRRMHLLLFRDDREIFRRHHQRLFETGTPQECEVRMVRRDGTPFWAHLSAAISKPAAGEAVCRIVISDITGRKAVEEALRESENRYHDLSIIDDLTQLHNARHFHHQLGMEIERADRYGQPLSLMLLDLDDFKRFNDTYGHVEGDQVLFRLGQVIKRCLRHTDSAYRYGGEEFTVLLPMTAGPDGIVTAERIRSEFGSETFTPLPERDVQVTVSIGLAQHNQHEHTKAFIHRVDQLMYQAKRGGKNRVCSKRGQAA